MQLILRLARIWPYELSCRERFPRHTSKNVANERCVCSGVLHTYRGTPGMSQLSVRWFNFLEIARALQNGFAWFNFPFDVATKVQGL